MKSLVSTVLMGSLEWPTTAMFWSMREEVGWYLLGQVFSLLENLLFHVFRNRSYLGHKGYRC